MTCPRPTNLTASNIAGRTATLSWTENGTATNWVLQYATDASFAENLVEVNVSGTASKDLANLSPETKYYARVKSVLGSDESSWSDVKDFTTTATCVKPTGVTANNITAYTATIGWTNGEEGQDAWEISYSTSTQSNPENGTVIPVTTNPYTLNGLTSETSYYVYVRADCGSEDGKSAWSSYKYFTTLATCVKPTGLTASNVTSSTATITWTAGETGQDAWNLQYKKSSDSEWQSVAVSTTSYNLTNLSPVTTYNVRVQADCGEGDLSQWTSNTNFTTECAALTLPYTYGFEENLQTASPYSSSNPFPKCWSRIAYQSGYYGSYTYYPYVFTATTSQPYAHGGNGANSYSGHSLRFYQTSSSTNECAVLPEISDDYEMNQLQIRFWAAVQSSQGTLAVGIMESPSNASTFTSIQEVTVSNTYSSGFQEFTIPFSAYSGNGRYIAFMCGTGSAYAYFLIDDITVEVVPTCFVPTELEATVNSATQTTLTWQAGGTETEWELEVTAAGSGFAQTAMVSDNPTFSLTTTQATSYSARVRAHCGDGDYSDWSAPISFTSDCGVLLVDASHPFLEDFENVDASDFPPICWEKFSHEMSGYTYWYLNSNNDLGSSAAYSYWSEGYAFLVMPKMHIDGNATLSFDYLIGSGTYDESCSVVVSTGEMTYNDFSQTIWEADGSNSGSAIATISLEDFDGAEIYIAFKYKGSGTGGCTWYIDNVHVFVPVNQNVELTQGWNWFVPTVDVSLEELETALGTNGISIISQNSGIATYDEEDEEWSGTLTSLVPGQVYNIKVSNDCNFTLSGIAVCHLTITIEQGSNWFGYTGLQSVAIEQALNGFTPAEGDRIFSFDEGFVTYEDNEWSGSFTHLQPGHGYIYISQDSESKTLNF